MIQAELNDANIFFHFIPSPLLQHTGAVKQKIKQTIYNLEALKVLLISATECYSFHFVVFFAVLSGDLPTELIGLQVDWFALHIHIRKYII